MKIGVFTFRQHSNQLVNVHLVEALIDLGHEVIQIGQVFDGVKSHAYGKYNVEYISIPMIRVNTQILEEITSFIQAISIIKNQRLDSLLIYGVRSIPTMVVAAKLAGVKQVFCIANGSGRLFELTGLKGFLVRSISYPMLCLALMSANFVFFHNPDDLALFKKKGLLWKENYGRVNGSGVDLDDFQIVPLGENPVFTMVCRITGDKGVNEYIQAAFKIKSLYPQAIFYLIGPMDDDDESVNKNALYAAVKKEIIKVTGRVADVRPYLELSRFYVLPSYHEGTSRTVLEAMAMGRPVITTDARGCRETVVDGVNGFLVPVRNANILAEKMVWMIENPDKVEAMGIESRRIAEEKFDVLKINAVILKKMLKSE